MSQSASRSSITRRGFAALGGASVLAGCTSAPAALDRSKFGQLTYVDDFDRPDWQARYITHFSHGDPDGPSSRRTRQPDLNEDDYASPKAIIPLAGRVALEARPATPEDQADGAKFIGGLLSTQGLFTQRYGYFECRFTAPASPGLWPSFWLLEAPVADVRDLPAFGTPGAARTRNWKDTWSAGLNGELDVVEILTNDLKTSYHTASARAHWVDKPGGERTETVISRHFPVKNPNPADAPHTYGALWGPQEIAWYRDDIEVARCPNPGLNSDMYLLMSMGTGGWNDNEPEPDMSPASMVIDRVRVYAL